MPARNRWVIYVDPVPIAVAKVAKVLSGEVSGRKVASKSAEVWEWGKIVLETSDDPSERLRKLVKKIREVVVNLQIIAFGQEDVNGRLLVYVTAPRFLTSVLAREVADSIEGLGLFSAKTMELSYQIANEMLCKITIEESVDNESRILAFSDHYSGYFILDSKTRKQMISSYSKLVNKYVSATNRLDQGVLRRVASKLGIGKREMAAALIAAAIVEGCYQLVIYLSMIKHEEEGKSDIKQLNLPEPLEAKVRSRTKFASAEVAAELHTEEIEILTTLNTLRKLHVAEIVDKKERIFVGTGKIDLPLVTGSMPFPTGSKGLVSGIFGQALDIPTTAAEKLDLDSKQVSKLYAVVKSLTALTPKAANGRIDVITIGDDED